MKITYYMNCGSKLTLDWLQQHTMDAHQKSLLFPWEWGEKVACIAQQIPEEVSQHVHMLHL